MGRPTTTVGRPTTTAGQPDHRGSAHDHRGSAHDHHGAEAFLEQMDEVAPHLGRDLALLERIGDDRHEDAPVVVGSAEALVHSAGRETVCGVPDPGLEELVEEVLGYPSVPPRSAFPGLSSPLVPVIPVHFRRDDFSASYFSTVTTLGTPQDVTLQELRIECFFPVEEPPTDRGPR